MSTRQLFYIILVVFYMQGLGIFAVEMALPHMPSAYTTRKNIYEAAIVRRRTQEDDLRESWQDTARYFNTAELRSSKDANWTSKATFESRLVVIELFDLLS